MLLWLTPLLVPVLALWFARVAPSDPSVRGPIWIFCVVVTVGAWWSYLSVPRTVIINGADLVFERPIGKSQLVIGEIRSIDARAWNRGFVVINARRRKIFLLQGTKNLSAIVTGIRQQKPSVTIIGKMLDGV
jgi:tellurite resistance protein TehA-like permease